METSEARSFLERFTKEELINAKDGKIILLVAVYRQA